MADEEGKENAPRGNDWEVVSLTASAYAAAPGPEQVDSSQDSQGKLDAKHEAETSSAMFMSSHFDFPPSQHENLPLEPEYNEIHNEKGSEDVFSQLVKDEGVISDVDKDEENVTFRGLMSDEFPVIPIFDDKGNILSGSGADFGKGVAFDNVQSIYNTAEFSSFHNETAMGKSNNNEEGEGADDSIEPLDSALDSDLPDFQKPFEGTNMMRMGRMLGPISRFKDVIVGGNRRGSLVRGSASTER
ncbi:hypothetical protein DH2020_011580 [Rehmannia glutinosa]|uniref:Uncharacterized protein n=1 Tax=Rehmannia glutinosa TaxID=99300 RepID=A0ABR0XDT6_REHGL